MGYLLLQVAFSAGVQAAAGHNQPVWGQHQGQQQQQAHDKQQQNRKKRSRGKAQARRNAQWRVLNAQQTADRAAKKCKVVMQHSGNPQAAAFVKKAVAAKAAAQAAAKEAADILSSSLPPGQAAEAAKAAMRRAERQHQIVCKMVRSVKQLE